MVKTFPLFETCITRVKALFNRMVVSFQSILPSARQKTSMPILLKKRKSISKSNIRAHIKSKLNKKRRNNADASSQQQPSFREVSDNNGQQHSNEPNQEDAESKFAEFLTKSQEGIMCSVCRSLILQPAITQCDHIFCLECIQNSMIISNKCPLCRAIIGSDSTYGIRHMQSIENIILMKNSRYEDDEDFKTRMVEHQTWKKKRFVDLEALTPGEKVDIWKSDSREWKKSEIVDILKDEDNITSLLISYDKMPKEQNQIIELPTYRIAKYNFYSGKYDNDDFTFPEVHFRNSIRMGTEFELNILPTFRRTLHQRIAHNENPFGSSRFGNLLRRPMNTTNMINIVPRVPFEDRSSSDQTEHIGSFPRSNNQDQPSDQFLIDILTPEEIHLPNQHLRQGQIVDLLPNLNPESQFRREAQNSSESESEFESASPNEIFSGF